MIKFIGNVRLSLSLAVVQIEHDINKNGDTIIMMKMSVSSHYQQFQSTLLQLAPLLQLTFQSCMITYLRLMFSEMFQRNVCLCTLVKILVRMLHVWSGLYKCTLARNMNVLLLFLRVPTVVGSSRNWRKTCLLCVFSPNHHVLRNFHKKRQNLLMRIAVSP